MKNVLLSTLGGSPKTVTEMFQALRFKGIDIDEIQVIGTKGSRTVPEEYRPAAVGYPGVSWRECPSDAVDIKSKEDAEEIGNLIFCTLKRIKERQDVARLFLDLTGGRKEMSSYLMLCAQLLCSEDDELYHVEVNDPSGPLYRSKHPDYPKYYYPRSPEEVTLILVPFVRLNSVFQSTGKNQATSLWSYLEQARKSLDRLSLAGLLAAGVDHELASPLLEAYAQAPQIRDVLDEISGIFHTFARVVKPEKLGRERERIELPEVVGQLRKMVDKRIDDLFVTADVPEIAVTGSRILLLRVLWIIAKNAKKHGEATELNITVRGEGRTVTLEVENNGRQMERHQIAEAFQVFKSYRPHGEGEQVGLPTVKALVEAMGGEVSIVERDGHAASFRLVLPEEK